MHLLCPRVCIPSPPPPPPPAAIATAARHISACMLQIRALKLHNNVGIRMESLHFNPPLSLAVIPVAFPPVTANPAGLSQSIRSEPRRASTPVYPDRATCKCATRGRFNGTDAVTRAEVKRGRTGRCGSHSYVTGQSGGMVDEYVDPKNFR